MAGSIRDSNRLIWEAETQSQAWQSLPKKNKIFKCFLILHDKLHKKHMHICPTGNH